MVLQSKSSKGHDVLKMSFGECVEIFDGGLGICDKCNDMALTGYYVPVLNWYLCPDCYHAFVERTPYYPEDAGFEQSQLNSVLNRIKQLKLPLQKKEGFKND